MIRFKRGDLGLIHHELGPHALCSLYSLTAVGVPVNTGGLLGGGLSSLNEMQDQ